MKYPLALTALALVGIYVIGTVAHGLTHSEQCPVSVAYTFPSKSPGLTTKFKKETARHAKKLGYKFMDSGLDGTLTLYAPRDPDRLIVNFNDSNAVNKVSFYDCRKGGNGAATGISWFSDVGKRYL